MYWCVYPDYILHYADIYASLITSRNKKHFSLLWKPARLCRKTTHIHHPTLLLTSQLNPTIIALQRSLERALWQLGTIGSNSFEWLVYYLLKATAQMALLLSVKKQILYNLDACTHSLTFSSLTALVTRDPSPFWLIKGEKKNESFNNNQ